MGSHMGVGGTAGQMGTATRATGCTAAAAAAVRSATQMEMSMWASLRTTSATAVARTLGQILRCAVSSSCIAHVYTCIGLGAYAASPIARVAWMPLESGHKNDPENREQ